MAQFGTRPLLMGILNVTPDSFSDGGRYQDVDAALAQAERMSLEGADIIDIGAESTRPAATPIGATEELARLSCVLERLTATLDVPLSIDTYKAAVAAPALARGAVLVNDPWGLQRDAAMAETVAEGEAAVVITHNRPDKDAAVDIVDDIRRFFDRSLALAFAAGIPGGRIILDPGIGFAKSARQNLTALARLDEFSNYRLPILVGVSRKRFLGSLAGGAEETPFGTVAAALTAVANGASALRVHDVAAHAAAIEVLRAVRGG